VALQLPNLKDKNQSGGTVEQVSIHGASTGLTEPGFVYLPPQYGQAAYARTAFPVIVVFTGYPGNATNLITRMKYPTVAAQAIEHTRLARQLAAERRDLIQILIADGWSQADVGRELGVSRQAIQKMLAC